MTDHMGRYVCNAGAALSLARAGETARLIACEQHGLRGEPARILGEALVAALVMATRLKGPGILVWQWSGQGLFRRLRVDAMGLGFVRALVDPELSEALRTWNGVDTLLGAGTLQISRQLEQHQQPYTSTLAITDEDIPAQAQACLEHSDQVTAHIHCDVRLDAEGLITQADGLYVERLPGTTMLPGGLEALLAGRQALGDETDDAALVTRLAGGATLQLLKDYPIRFHCPCERARFVATLRGFGQQQLIELSRDGIIPTRCDFCTSTYSIPLDEVL